MIDLMTLLLSLSHLLSVHHMHWLKSHMYTVSLLYTEANIRYQGGLNELHRFKCYLYQTAPAEFISYIKDVFAHSRPHVCVHVNAFEQAYMCVSMDESEFMSTLISVSVRVCVCCIDELCFCGSYSGELRDTEEKPTDYSAVADSKSIQSQHTQTLTHIHSQTRTHTH